MKSNEDKPVSSGTETDAADGRTDASELRKTLITILSTLIVAVTAGLMIHYFTKESNLPTITYSSDIVGFVDFAKVEGGRIQANGLSVPSLATVRLLIRNTSSDAVVKDISIHVQLVEPSEDFALLTLGHNPKPEIAFGTIRTEKLDERSLVFTYELLKPKEQDEVLFVVTCPPEVKLYTKASVKLSKSRWYSNQAFLFVLTFALFAVALAGIKFLLPKTK